jgi:EF hand domain-containing protein
MGRKPRSAASGVTMQQEKTMKTSTKLSLAFLTFAGLVSGAAYAAGPDGDGSGGAGGPGGRGAMMRFDRMDTDSSGDVTFEEFSAMLKSRVGDADADKDGKITVDELAAEIEKIRAERMAQRLIDRFDTDGDGVLTAAEVDSRQKKMFALLDKNDDGKIEKDEMPQNKGGRWGHRWGHGGGWGGDRW